MRIPLTGVIAILWITAAGAQDWSAAFEARVREIEQKNGKGTDPALAKRLMQMREIDQKAREDWLQGGRSEKLGAAMEEVDRRLTADLREMVERHGWPTIRLVGLPASQAAALILVHSADHDFQRQWLPPLMTMVDREEILGSDIALIADKILVSEKKLQRFGTQFKFQGDMMVLEPVEDPDYLEQRRARYLLPPMAEYKKMLAEMYKMKVE